VWVMRGIISAPYSEAVWAWSRVVFGSTISGYMPMHCIPMRRVGPSSPELSIAQHEGPRI
jgi:hypothetical protein